MEGLDKRCYNQVLIYSHSIMNKTVKRLITTFIVICSLTLVISCDKMLYAKELFRDDFHIKKLLDVERVVSPNRVFNK